MFILAKNGCIEDLPKKVEKKALKNKPKSVLKLQPFLVSYQKCHIFINRSSKKPIISFQFDF